VTVSEVTQTILLGDPSGRPGNCLQAAVASLFDLDLEDVPHFAESDGDWEAEFEAWVETVGYRIVWRGPSGSPPAFGLAFGFTNRSGERHAVVYRDGAMMWDPHPSRDGLTSVLTYLEFEAVRNPMRH
jgi:hypothetical protein